MPRNPKWEPEFQWQGRESETGAEIRVGCERWSLFPDHGGFLLPLLFCLAGMTSEGLAVSSSQFCSHRHSAVTCSSLTAVRSTSDFHAPLGLELIGCLGVGKLSSENIGCCALPCWQMPRAVLSTAHSWQVKRKCRPSPWVLEGAVPTDLKGHLLVPTLQFFILTQ